MMASVLVAFIFLILKWGSFKRLAITVPKLLVTALLLLALAYTVDPAYISRLSDRYYDAFTVVLTQQASQDASSNVRIVEIVLILPYLAKNWFAGNGEISNQWHGGYDSVLGGYFYPSDVGIVGVVYLYGLVGLVIFAIQFRFAWSFAKMIPKGRHTALVDAIIGFVLYFAVHSIVTGRFAHYAETGLLFTAMLSCAAYQWRNTIQVRWHRTAQ